jgi:GNAT superfamily N-acetyltransferase
MNTIPVKTYYLQMHAPPERSVPPPVEGTEVVAVDEPTTRYYRFLYDAVGSDWNWIERKRLSDDELRAILHDDRVELYVLTVKGSPAGFCEMDRRVDGEVELRYFGLMSESFGQGLGKYFLNWILRQAWSNEPNRVWVHTCDLDHVAALPMYQQAGLVLYDEKVADHAVTQPHEKARVWKGSQHPGARG